MFKTFSIEAHKPINFLSPGHLCQVSILHTNKILVIWEIFGFKLFLSIGNNNTKIEPFRNKFMRNFSYVTKTICGRCENTK